LLYETLLPRRSFFFSMALPAHSGPWSLIQFRIKFSQTVGPLGRVISPSQGRYLNTGQLKHRIKAYTPNFHASSVIRTHDPSILVSEDSSYLRLRGYCDRQDGHYSLNLNNVSTKNGITRVSR
jgi:hypothetical protein